MNLIAILICLVLQKLLNVGSFSSTSWLKIYLKNFKFFLGKLNGYVALFFAVAPILLVFSAIHILSQGHLFGLLHMVYTILVLFLVVDFREIKGTAKAVFIDSFYVIFAPLFWFIIFDIDGLVFYSLVRNLHKTALDVDHRYSGLVTAAEMVLNILNWLPLRITALSYALAGHFVTAFTYFYKKIISIITDINVFVVNTGLASLDGNIEKEANSTKENHAATSLVNRTLLIWVIALVLFTVGRWVA